MGECDTLSSAGSGGPQPRRQHRTRLAPRSQLAQISGQSLELQRERGPCLEHELSSPPKVGTQSVNEQFFADNTREVDFGITQLLQLSDQRLNLASE